MRVQLAVDPQELDAREAARDIELNVSHREAHLLERTEELRVQRRRLLVHRVLAELYQMKRPVDLDQTLPDLDAAVDKVWDDCSRKRESIPV